MLRFFRSHLKRSGRSEIKPVLRLGRGLFIEFLIINGRMESVRQFALPVAFG
jgi:hypothetical protein